MYSLHIMHQISYTVFVETASLSDKLPNFSSVRQSLSVFPVSMSDVKIIQKKRQDSVLDRGNLILTAISVSLDCLLNIKKTSISLFKQNPAFFCPAFFFSV